MMRLLNSTDYPDWFLRRMVSWCCKQLGLPVRFVYEAKFRKGGRCHARGTSSSGRAWGSRNRGRFVVTHGNLEPRVLDYHGKNVQHINKIYGGRWSDPVNICGRVVERTEVAALLKTERARHAESVLADLVRTTAHELAHLWLCREGSTTRRRGKPGGSERETNVYMRRIYAAFEADRETLLTTWNEPPKQRKSKPKATLQEKRAKAAQGALARWQRKLKLAQTKVKQYRQKVRYYERAIAAKAQPAGEEKI